MSPEEEQQGKDKLLQLAATAEQQSNHPLARAIITQCVQTRKLPLGALSNTSDLCSDEYLPLIVFILLR